MDTDYLIGEVHRLVYITEREIERLHHQILQIPLISSLTEEGFQILKEIGNYPVEWSRIRMSQVLGYDDRICFRIRPFQHRTTEYHSSISSRIIYRGFESSSRQFQTFQLPLMCLKPYILCWLLNQVFELPLISEDELENGSTRLIRYLSEGFVIEEIRRDMFFGRIPLYHHS